MEKIVLVVGTPAESKKDSNDIVNTILDLLSKEKTPELTKEDLEDIKKVHEECMDDFYKKHGGHKIYIPESFKNKCKFPKMTAEDYYGVWDRYLNPKATRSERKPNTPIKERIKDTPNESYSIEDVAGRIEGVARPLPEVILSKKNNMFNEVLSSKEIEEKAADFSLLYRISDIFDKYRITREELEEAIPKLDDMFSNISTVRTLGKARKEDTPVKNTNIVSQEVEDNKEMLLSVSRSLDQYAITSEEFKKEILPEFEKLIIKIAEERKESSAELYDKVYEIVSILCDIPIGTLGEHLNVQERADFVSNLTDIVQKRIINKETFSTDHKLELLKITHKVVQVYLYAMSHREVLEYNGKGIDVASYIVREISK